MWILSVIVFGLIGSLAFCNNINKPFLQEITLPKSLAENKTVKLNCNLLQGEFANFEWFLNENKIELNNRRRIINNEESSELTIKSLQIEDLGEIKCKSINKYGQDSQKVSLLFNGKLGNLQMFNKFLLIYLLFF